MPRPACRGEPLGPRASDFRIQPPEHPVPPPAPPAPSLEDPEPSLRLRGVAASRGHSALEAARLAARDLGARFTAEDFEGLLLEFAYVWNLNGLGTVAFESPAGCEFRVANCGCCGDGGCGFVAAFVETVLRSRLGLGYEVAETRCGPEDCRFEIRIAEPADAY